jgi:hypothetical protein
LISEQQLHSPFHFVPPSEPVALPL